LSDPSVDSLAIALDALGYMIVPQDGHAEKWALIEHAPVCPSWCSGVREQERQVKRSIQIATAMHRREFAEG
jgi:hypothetical protein